MFGAGCCCCIHSGSVFRDVVATPGKQSPGEDDELAKLIAEVPSGGTAVHRIALGKRNGADGRAEVMQTESQSVSRLRSRRIPVLRPNAYGCVVRERTFTSIATELNACVKELPNASMFDVHLEFDDDIELDATGASRPLPEDFETEADYDEAADAVLEKYDRSLPWCRVKGDVERKIRALLNWDLNDKDYVYTNAAGESVAVDVTFDRGLGCWTARNSEQLHLFNQLEQEHEAAIGGVVNDVKQLIAGKTHTMFEAEHLLVDGDAYGWICFFDEALAILTDRHAILLWAGFDSWYG